METALENKLRTVEAYCAEMTIGIANKVIVVMKARRKYKNKKEKDEALQ